MRTPESWLTTHGVPDLNPPQVLGDGATTQVALQVALSGVGTRSEIMRRTGLGRSKVTHAWQRLQQAKLLAPAGREKREDRGQPSVLAQVYAQAGLVLAVDCGASIVRASLVTLGRRILLREQFPARLAGGPDGLLTSLSELLDKTLPPAIAQHGPLRHITIGIPARIDYTRGAPVRPTIMPGWDGVQVGRMLEDQYGADVFVDNEMNLRAYAESLDPSNPGFPVVAVKVGWGIGAGIAIAPGQILHGFSGAAGELGHTPIVDIANAVKCRCGKTNCIEARASLGAIIAATVGTPPETEVNLESQTRLTEALFNSDPVAQEAVLAAGLLLGENLANVCDLLNPRVISLTSVLNASSEGILSGVRANVHAKSRPLASRDVSVRLASYGEDTGLIGGLAMAITESIKTICAKLAP